MSNEPEKTMIITTGPSGDAEKDTKPNAAGTAGKPMNIMPFEPSGDAEKDTKPSVMANLMNIQQLDQGISRLRERSDRIKKKGANTKDLEVLEQELRQHLIENNALGSDKRKPLKDYVYDDLCDGVIQELTNTYQLSKHSTYTQFQANKTEQQIEDWLKEEEAKYVEKVINLLLFFMDLVIHELKNNRYNENLLRACAWIFDPRTQLHKTYYQLKKEHLDRYWTETEEQMWRRELKVDDYVDVRVQIDIRKDDTHNGNYGWIQGRITKVSACEADINRISMKNREHIINAYVALDESERKEDEKGKEKLENLSSAAQKLKRACEHTFVGSEQDLSDKQKKLANMTKGVANELTIVFNQLPAWRDTLIDRWSFDLAQHESQTRKEYDWKKDYEFQQTNNDDYGSEEEGPEEEKKAAKPLNEEEKKKQVEAKAKKDAIKLRRRISKEVRIKENDNWWDGTIVNIFKEVEEDKPNTIAEMQAIEDSKQKKDPKKKEKKVNEEEEKKKLKVDKENPKRVITYVTVGFRVYCKEGNTSNKKDENDEYFFGFGKRTDLQIPLFDPRLKMADKHRISKYHPDNEQMPEVIEGEDSEEEKVRWAENCLLDELEPYSQDENMIKRSINDCRIREMGLFCCYCATYEAAKEQWSCHSTKCPLKTQYVSNRMKNAKCICKTFCFPREQVSVSTKFIEMINYFGNMGGFQLIQDVLSKRFQKIKTKEEIKNSESAQEYQPPSLTAICQLTMMISMPFQLFHYDFIMGTDGEEEEEEEEDSDAWMFFSPSSYPSKKTLDYAHNYWKIDGNRLHDSKMESHADVDEDAFMFFNASAIPSKDTYFNAACALTANDKDYNKRVFGRTYAGYGLAYTEYVQQQLLRADQASLKALQTSDIGQMQFSLTQVYYAIEDEEDADLKSQKLKLDICKMCLDAKNTSLELKIWCVTELSDLIKLRIDQSFENQGQNVNKNMADMRKRQLQILVSQMKDCGVFNLIWTISTTSESLVKASADMFKKLAQQQILDLDLMSKFWSLTGEQYLRVEVFKILQDTHGLEEKHLDFIVQEISKISNNSRDSGAQLSELELKLLADNVSFRRSEKQKPKIVDLFWSILRSSDKYSKKLVEESITCFDKFYKGDIGSYECLNLLKQFVKELKEYSARTPTASYIILFCQLFKKIQNNQKIKKPDLVRDALHIQESRFMEAEENYFDDRKKAKNQGKIDLLDDQFEDTRKKHKIYVDTLSLAEIVTYAVEHLNLKTLITANLKLYKEEANNTYQKLLKKDQIEYNYKETFLLPNYSQFDQVTQRVEFLSELSKYTAQEITNTDLQNVFQVCKVPFDKTPDQIKITDMEVFFKWCSMATESVTLKNFKWQEDSESRALEGYVPLSSETCIGFINKKINDGEMVVDKLPLKGYEFLEDQFKKLNKENILEHAQPVKKGKIRRLMGARPYQPDDALYKIWIDPKELSHIAIIEQVAYQSEDEDVVDKSIGLFVNCYLAMCDEEDQQRYAKEKKDHLDKTQRKFDRTANPEDKEVIKKQLEELKKQEDKVAVSPAKRQEFAEEIINKIFAKIDEVTASQKLTQIQKYAPIRRMIKILEQIIVISEKKGMKVKPHKAVLKGDMLQQIKVKYFVADVQDFTRRVENRHVIVEPRTTTTVWEFVDQVSRMLGLGYRHLKLTIFDINNKPTILRDYHYGKTLAEMGLRAMSNVEAERMPVFDTVQQATLCHYKLKHEMKAQGASTTKKKVSVERPDTLTQECKVVVEHLFDLIKNPVTQKIESDGALEYLERSLNKKIQKGDKDYMDLMKNIPRDLQREGITGLDLEGFEKYIVSRCDIKKDENSKRDVAILRQLKYDGIKKNLQYFSDEAITKTAQDKMPRYIISNQRDVPAGQPSRFQKLFALLEGRGFSEDGEKKRMQTEVWQLIRMLATNEEEHAKLIPNGQVDSQTFWDRTFNDPNDYMKIYKQDIVYDLMEKEQIDEIRKVKWASGYDKYCHSVNNLSLPKNLAKKLKCIETPVEDKQRWTAKFLADQHGFDTIKTQFFALDVKKLAQKEIKETAFWSTLIQNNFSQKGLEASDLRKLTRHSLDLLHRTLQKKIIIQVEDEDREIVNEFNRDVDGKIIIENALQTFTQAVKIEPALYTEFKTHKEEGHEGADIALIKIGCFNEELRVRFAFRDNLIKIPRQFNTPGEAALKQDALDFFMSKLHDDYFRQKNPTSSFTHEYFELYSMIVDEKRQTLQVDGVLYPALRQLLEQVRKQVKQQQEQKSNLKAAETEAEEIKTQKTAEENEILCVDLIAFTKKLVNSAGQIGRQLVNELELVRSYFEDYLFASHYSQASATGANKDESNQSDVIEQSGSRAGDKKKSVVSSVKSKKAAFDLLIEFMGDDREVLQKFIKENMYELVTDHMPTPDKWGQEAFKQSMRYQKFVGLENAGAICYMNSILQQFFMIPSLRYNIIGIERESEVDNFDKMTPQKIKDKYFMDIDKTKIDKMGLTDVQGDITLDNPLYQLQKLMSNLECSELTTYDTQSLAHTYYQNDEDFNWNRTDLKQQKDSNEFLTEFSDTITSQLKDSSRKFIIQDTFEFQKCRQLICPNCNVVKNRIEHSKSLSLGIKNVSSVEEAIKRDVDGEHFDDYRCSSCNEEVRMKKRELLASSPNVLIVHINRIGYNIQLNKPEKINTQVKFQTELDLRPYSFHHVINNPSEGEVEHTRPKTNEEIHKDQKDFEEIKNAKEKEEFAEKMQPLEEDCWLYKLVGINVHSGSARSGHYWSYINTNRSGERIDGNWNQTENWMEFNDTQVSNWDFKKQVESRCFGSAQQETNQGTSAYMLFYERVKKKDIRLVLYNKIGEHHTQYSEEHLMAALEAKTDHELKLLAKEKEDYYTRQADQDRQQEADREADALNNDQEQDDDMKRQQEEEKKQAQVQRILENQKVEQEYKVRMKQIEERRNIHELSLLEAEDSKQDSKKVDQVLKNYKYIKLPFAFAIENGQTSTEDDEATKIRKQHLYYISKLFFGQNAAYRQVIDANKKQNFKVDAYSHEFLTFVPQLFEKVAKVDPDNGFDHDALQKTLQIGRKVAFEIMAKIQTNKWIGEVSEQMIKIIRDQNANYKIGVNLSAAQQQAGLIANEVNEETDLASYFICQTRRHKAALKGILVNCPDSNAQKQVCTLISYALCHLKTAEAEKQQVWVEGTNIEKYGQLFQFVHVITNLIQQAGNEIGKTEKARQLACFLQLFYDVMVHDKDTIIREMLEKEDRIKNPHKYQEEEKKQPAQVLINTRQSQYQYEYQQKKLQNINKYKYKKEGLAFKRGLKMYDALIFSNGRLVVKFAIVIKFYSEDRKAARRMYVPGGYRLDLTYLQRTVALMMNEAIIATKNEDNPLGLMDFSDKVNLTESDRRELAKTYILEKMLNPDEGEIEDFVPSLHFLATDSEKITRKVGRNYLSQMMDQENIYYKVKKMTKYLNYFEDFVKLDDRIKAKRIELLLGFPTISSEVHKRTEVLEYGTYKMGGKKGPYADRPYYKFKSACCSLHSEAFLGIVNYYCTGSKNEKNNNFLLGAKLMETLATLMVGDEQVRKYVRNVPHPTLRFHNFMQSFVPMTEEMKIECITRLAADDEKAANKKAPEHLRDNWVEALKQCEINLAKVSEYAVQIGYQDEDDGRAKHIAHMEKFMKYLKEAENKENRNKSAQHHGNSRPHLLRVPNNFLHQNKAPYPYIVGGQSEARDEDVSDFKACTYHIKANEQTEDKGESAQVKIQFKKLETSWVYSMPFGKHNSALPEMQYKMPTDISDKPTKLSYFEILEKKQYNKDGEEEKKDGRRDAKIALQQEVNAFFTDDEYDTAKVAGESAIVKVPKESKNENEDAKGPGRNRGVGGGRGGFAGGMGGFARGGGIMNRQFNMVINTDNMDMFRLGAMMNFDDGFDGIQPRNFVHELDGVQNNTVCIGLYCELQNRQGDNQVKAKITIRESIVRENLNFDFPLTPVVHYTNNQEKSFIMMITKKNPELPGWYITGDQGTEGYVLADIFAISYTNGYPPRDYMRDLRRDEDSDDSEDEYRRHRRRHGGFDFYDLDDD